MKKPDDAKLRNKLITFQPFALASSFSFHFSFPLTFAIPIPLTFTIPLHSAFAIPFHSTFNIPFPFPFSFAVSFPCPSSSFIAPKHYSEKAFPLFNFDQVLTADFAFSQHAPAESIAFNKI